MKVALIAGEIPTTVFINRLVNGLAKNGVEVFVFGTIYKTPYQVKNVKFIGFSARFGKLLKLLFYLKYVLLLTFLKPKEKKQLDAYLVKSNLNSRIKKGEFYPLLWHKPDIVHVQWAKKIDQFMWVKEFGMKITLSLRGTHINQSPLTIPGLSEKYMTCFPKLDGFHGVSRAICVEATKFGADINKCQVAYSGFSIKEFPKKTWRTSHKIGKNDPIRIISVGRANWVKGYHFALDAAKILQDESVQFHYDIIGAMGDEELMFQKSQLALDDAVTFHDRVPFEEVKKRIAEADVLLLPSLEEGIANVVLEAMFLGTLVITTNCGGMVESVENNHSGVVVPVRNPKAIAEALKNVITMPTKTRLQMTENAYQKVCEQHNEAKMVADMLSLYNNVLLEK